MRLRLSFALHKVRDPDSRNAVSPTTQARRPLQELRARAGSRLPRGSGTDRIPSTLHWKDLRAARTCVQLVVAKRKDTESLEICREHNMEGWKFSGGAVHPGPSISTFSHIASRDQLQYTELRIQESLRGPSEKL